MSFIFNYKLTAQRIFNFLVYFDTVSYRFLQCSLPIRTQNPLKKKEFQNGLKNLDEKEDTRICATILGNGALGQPRCIGLFTNHKGILFNCGEGIGRIFREYEGAFHQIKHVFITKQDWCNLSGLADIHLTHEAYGVKRLNIFGPPGIEHFMSVVTGEITQTKLVKRNMPYKDDNFEISSICISADIPFKTVRRGTKMVPDIVYAYQCKIIEKPPELSAEKLIEHNVPFGSDILKLKNGEDVILSSGKIIRSSDVIESSNKEEILLIVDCPNEHFLLPVVVKGEFSRYQLPLGTSKVSTIFHFTPPHIMKTKLYQDWMKKFHPETQHIVLNTSCPTISSHAVHNSQSIFHNLHPDIFKLLPNHEIENQDFGMTSSVIHAPSMLQIQFRPKKEINWKTVVKYIPENYIQEANCFPGFMEEINNLKSIIGSNPQFSSQDATKYPEVIFFGTGSATSTAYRNVTAIILNISRTKSILLDCGEGTFLQYVRYFGPKSVDAELRRISCIFVSHLHTDHYLGLFQLLKSRIEAFEKYGIPYQPIALLLPYKIKDMFRRYCLIFDPMLLKVRIFLCNSIYKEKKLESLQKFIGDDLEIETVNVKHCIDAHGIVLKKSRDWKIVYSGDSAPCQKLIDAGRNCTLLIHEASIEDGCMQEAMLRMHSTPSQVVDIAERMNAKHTIMTHFSKRYLAMPVYENNSDKIVGCAFDFMKVQMHQLPLLPHFMPAIKCIFQDQLKDHAERTSFYTTFENSFLKNYRQAHNKL